MSSNKNIWVYGANKLLKLHKDAALHWDPSYTFNCKVQNSCLNCKNVIKPLWTFIWAILLVNSKCYLTKNFMLPSRAAVVILKRISLGLISETVFSLCENKNIPWSVHCSILRNTTFITHTWTINNRFVAILNDTKSIL